MHAVLGIHDQHAHVRVLNGTGRPQRGVKLHVVIDLAALTQTGRVDEHERSTVPRERRVDRVPGRTGLVRHYQALGTEQAVHEARLPDIRTAHHGHPDLGLLARGGRGGEAGHDLVEQVTGARADACGDWKRVAQTELVEREVPGVRGQMVRLVGDEDHRAAGLPQIGGDLLVGGVDAFRHVHEKQHQIALGHRGFDLRSHRAAELVLRARDHPAGVHEPEAPSVPLGRAEMPIPRHAGAIVHDRLPPADQPVEERGLPDIGPTDDGDGGGPSHAATSSAASASAKS